MNKRIILVLIFICLTIGGLTGWRYMELDKLNGLAVNYGELESQIHQLDTENIILRQQILTDSALTHIYDIAKQEGFSDGVYILLK